MGVETRISWCDHTWNAWRGCQKVDDACANCYAEALSDRNPGVLGAWGPPGIGARVAAADSYWRQILRWDRLAAAAGERRRVFALSLGDVFEEWGGPVSQVLTGRPLYTTYGADWFVTDSPHPHARPVTLDDLRDRLHAAVALCRNLDFLLLTKRPAAAERYYRSDTLYHRVLTHADYYWRRHRDCPRGPVSDPTRADRNPNRWLGVSVGNQRAAEALLPAGAKVPAALRFVSVEPLIGPVDFGVDPESTVPRGLLGCRSCGGWGLRPTGSVDVNGYQQERGCRDCRGTGLAYEWVIAGGESGPGRREMDLGWLAAVAGQAGSAGAEVFVKQDSGPRDGDRGRIPDWLWAMKEVPASPARRAGAWAAPPPAAS